MTVPSTPSPRRPTAPWIALLAGALTVFAFAPFHLWALQLVTLATVTALLLREQSPRRAALIGWLYGFGWSVCGIYWLYISMHRYGGMPSWMAALAVVLLALFVGGYSAAAAAMLTWLRRRLSLPATVAALLVWPALWGLSEWARGWIFTGFPWLASGYAHSTGPLAGFAPLIGVYGVAIVAAMIAASIALWPQTRRAAAIGALLLLAGWGCGKMQWTSPHGAPLTVRLLQGNVPQEMKFNPDQANASLALYRELITAAPADLIATPETAIPMLAQQLPPDYLPSLAAWARQSGSHLLLGMPLSDTPGAYANSAIGVAPDGGKPYRYDKHHLVPFGEFVPPGFRWFVNMMNIPLGDFDRAAVTQPPFRVKDQSVMPNICYEDLFGDEIAQQFTGPASPTILLNLSNIAWFGDTIALPQHLQISQMRSLETGRPMLRATNTGVTALIDPSGKVVETLAPYTRAALPVRVQGYAGLTPFVRMGDAGAVTLALLLLAAGCLRSPRLVRRPR